MSIQPTHQKNSRHGSLFARPLGPPHIQGHLRPLILFRPRRVRNLDVLNRTLEQRRSFHIRLLLRLISLRLDRAVDIRKSRDSIHGAGAKVDLNGGLFVSFFRFGVSLRDEIFGRREEFFRVLVAVAVVDSLLDEGFEDGGEVFVLAVVEGVEGAFAGEFPFLVPGK